jgi:hypothetical protein
VRRAVPGSPFRALDRKVMFEQAFVHIVHAAIPCAVSFTSVGLAME